MRNSALKQFAWLALGFLGVVVSLQVAIGNANTPPASKTGAPSENTCIQCHQGTAGTGSVSMVFGNNETSYVPGQVYTISVNVTDATRTRFGFQITGLAGGVGPSVGTFAVTNATNTSTQLANVAGNLRRYISHKSANGNQNWTFNWTAPATDIGPITFFLVGLGANNSNSDAGDKVYSTTFTITAVPPPPPVAAFTVSDTNICVGTSATFTDVSAPSPSSHSWIFPGGTPGNSNDPNPTVLYTAAGTYDVTLIVGNVSGADTVVLQNHIVVNDPPALSGLPAAAACFGESTGSINLSPAGAAPFTYQWDNGAVVEDPSSLAAGAYSVTVTDANGCASTASFTVGEPTAIALAFTAQNANCGQSNGSATVTASGGVGPYTYLWANGNTTATATALAAGSHDVTVSDANGCQMLGTAAVSNIGAPTGTAVVVDVTCNGESNGAVDLIVSNGVPPYTYQWSNGATTEDLQQVPAGTYSVTVTASNGCLLSQVVVVDEPALLTATVSSTPEQLGADGTATVVPTGGTGGYTFLWNDGQTGATATNLAAGTYTVVVTDNLGCTTTATVNVSLIISVAGSVMRPPFTVGPNPFADYLMLKPTVSIYGSFVVHLIDLDGRIVYANQVYGKGSSPVRLETGPLPNGIYLLKIHTAKGDMVRKVIHAEQ